MQQRGSALALVTLALVGIGISTYLTFVHYAHVPLVCSDSGFINCSAVLSSSYSVVPGTSTPITVPGLGFFIISLALALAQIRQPFNFRLRQAHVALAGLGMLTVCYLVFVELIELRTICLWCTATHLTILLTLILALWRLSPNQPAEPDQPAYNPTKPTIGTSRPH